MELTFFMTLNLFTWPEGPMWAALNLIRYVSKCFVEATFVREHRVLSAMNNSLPFCLLPPLQSHLKKWGSLQMYIYLCLHAYVMCTVYLGIKASLR